MAIIKEKRTIEVEVKLNQCDFKGCFERDETFYLFRELNNKIYCIKHFREVSEGCKHKFPKIKPGDVHLTWDEVKFTVLCELCKTQKSKILNLNKHWAIIEPLLEAG